MRNTSRLADGPDAAADFYFEIAEPTISPADITSAVADVDRTLPERRQLRAAPRQVLRHISGQDREEPNSREHRARINLFEHVFRNAGQNDVKPHFADRRPQ